MGASTGFCPKIFRSQSITPFLLKPHLFKPSLIVGATPLGSGKGSDEVWLPLQFTL